MRKLAFAVVALAVVVLGTAAPLAYAPPVTEVRSAVSLRIDDFRLSGQVTSSAPECESKRTVFVLAVQKGRNRELDATQTDAEGEWSVKIGSLNDGTRLRAKLKEGATPGFVCLNAVSPVRVYRKLGEG